MKAFSHFLITRFNTKVGYCDTRCTTDPDWLDYRFNLFKQFCYPSVCAQTNQGFKWLILFDKDTPDVFKNKIAKYLTRENIILGYVEKFNSRISWEAVAEHLREEPEYLITSRIDTDDAIHKDFIQIVQDNFKRQKREFLNFLYGYIWKKDKIYLYEYPANPFISLVEKAEDFKTVYCEEHTRISRVAAVRNIISKPAWIQVIHEKNSVITFKGGIRKPISRLENDFIINNGTQKIKENNLLCLLDELFCILRAVSRKSLKIMQGGLRRCKRMLARK